MAVSHSLKGKVRIDCRGAHTNQHGKIMRIQTFRRADIDGAIGAQTKLHQMRMHAAGGENHGQSHTSLGDLFIAQDNVGIALAHRIFRLALDPLNGIAKGTFALLPAKGAINMNSTLAHNLIHTGKHGIGHHGAVEGEDFNLRGILIQHIAKIAETGLEGHNPIFSKRIDGRVGNLGKILPEKMAHGPVLFGQHRQRRVITHGPDSLLGLLNHGLEQQFKIFKR